MKTSRTVLWAALTGLGLAAGLTTAAVSAGNPVEDRQATMKGVAQSMKEGGALQAAFDPAKAKTAMGAVADAAKKLKGLYPAGSDKDPKSGADPKVWTQKADFEKRLAEMGTLATNAGKAKDADSYKVAYKALGETCKSCHDVYRMKKKPA
jgi:cytochrome c556